MKELTVYDEVTEQVTVVFRLEESAEAAAAEYFRDLSENYTDYVRGVKPWPTRPEGLINSRDTRFEEEEL